MRPLLAALVLLLMLPAAVLAARPLHAGNSQPFTLYFEHTQETDPGNVRPDWCWNEDDLHERRWTGDLAPGESLVVTEQFCDPAVDGVSAGGVGLFVYAESRKPLTVLITQPRPQTQDGLNWPDPPYPYPYVPGLPFANGVASCVVPGWHTTTNQGFGPIVGGVYTVTIRNDTSRTVRGIYATVFVRMATANYQTGWCPEPYRNLVP